MTKRPKGERRKVRSLMATDAEWARIAEAAADAGLTISEYMLRCSLGQGGSVGLPLAVLRRMARAVLVLEEMEGRRLETQGAGEDWRRALDGADAWLDREAGIG